MRRRLVLLASDLSVCVKKNVYKSYEDMVYKYLKSFDEEAYNKLVAETNKKYDETEEKETQNTKAERDILVKHYQDKKETIIENDTCVEKLMTSIALNDYTIDIYVRGKCDIAVDEHGHKSVVMVRNRKNRLFRRVPEYEHVQLMAYMFLYDVKQGSVLEVYQGETCENVVGFYHVEFDIITLRAQWFASALQSLLPA